MNDKQSLINSFLKGNISRRAFVARSLALGVSLGSIETLLQSCGSSPSTSNNGGNTIVNFTTWGSTGFYARWRDTASAVEPAIKDIHLQVKVGGQGDTDVANQLRLSLTSGKNIPDVVQLNKTTFVEFAASGALQPLDDLYSSIKSDVYSGALSVVSYQNKIYGIPYEVKSKEFFYRADLFEKANIKVENIKSLDDFIQAGKELHGKFPKTYMLNMGPQPAAYWLGETLSAYPDVAMADSSGTFQITKNPAFADVFQFIKKLHDANIALPIDDWSNDWQQSLSGEAIAGLLIGDWMKFFLPQFAPNQKGLWKAALWPSFAPSLTDQRYGAEGGGSLFAFPTRAAHSQEAMTLFSKMFLSPKGSMAVFENGGTPPVLNSIKNDAIAFLGKGKPATMSEKDWAISPIAYFGPSYQEGEFESYNYVKAFNYDPQANKEFAILNLWLQKYVTGKASLSQALTGAQSDMQSQVGNPYKQ